MQASDQDNKQATQLASKEPMHASLLDKGN